MATSENKASKLSREGARKKRLTFLVMGSIGKVLSFQISARFLVACGLFFIAYLVISLYIINDYMQLRRTSGQTDQRVSRLEEENASQKKSLNKSGQHVALLEGYIRHLEEGADFSTPVKREQPRTSVEKVNLPAPTEKSMKPQKSNLVMEVLEVPSEPDSAMLIWAFTSSTLRRMLLSR